MQELNMAEVEEVSGGFLFMVIPGYIAYGVITAEVVAIGAYMMQ